MKPSLPLPLLLHCLSFLLVTVALLLGSSVVAQNNRHAQANYDEAKVPHYTLPDPLLTLDGQKVTDARTWREKRRPEILGLFATNVYGRTMIGRPKEMTWEVLSNHPAVLTATNGAQQPAVLKTVAIYFAGRKDGPKMILEMALPARRAQRAPAFLVPAGSSRFQKQVVSRGYALVNFDIKSIEPDATNGYPASVRAFFAAPGQSAPGADEWGAIGAWAWGASRALDYLLSDPDIEPARISIMGLSRWGKVAMWAGAQDERFAIVFSCESGCGGAVLVRRQFGETVQAITARFPHWFDRNFATFGDRVNELPVDWHMLIALMAPRPVYIATAEDDQWGDPRGSFLAAKAAEPVYRLFGKNGLGVDEMPNIETPVGETIGFHERRGQHAINEYDWDQFLNFADKQFAKTNM